MFVLYQNSCLTSNNFKSLSLYNLLTIIPSLQNEISFLSHTLEFPLFLQSILYVLLSGDDLLQRKHDVTTLYKHDYNKCLILIKVLHSIDCHNEMYELKRITLPHILHTSAGADTAHYITEIIFFRFFQETTTRPRIITFTDWSFF